MHRAVTWIIITRSRGLVASGCHVQWPRPPGRAAGLTMLQHCGLRVSVHDTAVVCFIAGMCLVPKPLHSFKWQRFIEHLLCAKQLFPYFFHLPQAQWRQTSWGGNDLVCSLEQSTLASFPVCFPDASFRIVRGACQKYGFLSLFSEHSDLIVGVGEPQALLPN